MKKIILGLMLIVGLIFIPAKLNAQVISLGQVVYPTAVIAASGTTSNYIQTNGMSLVGCQMPSTFTGSTITFTVAPTGGATYVPLYNSSGQVSYSVSQGRFIAINPQDFYGVQFFKIVSGSTEGSARSLACSMKGI